MLPQFIVTNIDAVITIALGLIATIYSLMRRERLSKSANGLTRLLRVLAPLVLIFGLIQFFIRGEVSDPPITWMMIQTDDGVARVEFPATPKRTEETDRAPGIEIHRVSHVANLAGGNLSFRLSFNEYPPQAEILSDEERVAEMREFVLQEGFVIEQDAELPDGIWMLVAAKPDAAVRISLRVRLMPSGIYRVLATSVPGHHDDPRIARFLNSFTVNNNQAEQLGAGQPPTRRYIE